MASVGATIEADEGPKLPCGFKKKKKKASIASSRLLFGETGDLRHRGLSSFSVRVKAAREHPTSPPTTFQRVSQREREGEREKKILLTYSRSSIQVFSHFPLSLHSTVAPRAPPPLRLAPPPVASPGERAWERPAPLRHNSY